MKIVVIYLFVFAKIDYFENNISYIQAHHREVMHEYEEVLLEIGGETVRDKFEKGPVRVTEEVQEEPVVTEEIGKEQLVFYLKALIELMDTFEKDEVENRIKELSVYSYQGISLKDMLKPICEKVNQFDFLTAAEEVTKLLKEGGNANA